MWCICCTTYCATNQVYSKSKTNYTVKSTKIEDPERVHLLTYKDTVQNVTGLDLLSAANRRNGQQLRLVHIQLSLNSFSILNNYTVYALKYVSCILR